MLHVFSYTIFCPPRYVHEFLTAMVLPMIALAFGHVHVQVQTHTKRTIQPCTKSARHLI